MKIRQKSYVKELTSFHLKVKKKKLKKKWCTKLNKNHLNYPHF